MQREKNWIVNRSSNTKTTIEWLAPIITHAHTHTPANTKSLLHSLPFSFIVTDGFSYVFFYRMHVCGSLIYIYILQSNPLIHRQFCVGGVAACERIDGVPCNFKPISYQNASYETQFSFHSFVHHTHNIDAYAYRRLAKQICFIFIWFCFAYSLAVAQ